MAWGPSLTLPKLSIAAKLYAIFALMATTTVVLSMVAALNARSHVVLTRQLESVNTDRSDAERLDALIDAVFGNTHAIFTAPDTATAAKYASELTKLSDRLDAVAAKLQSGLPANGLRANGQRANDAVGLKQFGTLLASYRAFLQKMARVASAQGPAAARQWAGTNSIFDMHGALSKSLEKLRRHYTERVNRMNAELDRNIVHDAMLLSLFAGLAVLLAGTGALIIWRGVTKPIGDITRVTEAVAAGDAAMAVPFGERKDEIGALSRSIAVFQRAMHHNEELNRAVTGDAQTRAQRQEQMSAEIARFSAEVESTLAELGRISDQMLAASGQLAGAADDATAKTARAAEASSEASANVRDIASAAEELSASVNEIDRQVAQSNAIATKAVNEAGHTNLAVKELDEAAARIGDVVKLITDIAEQTNLLALNATIEAARAGEAGRGFAVVAGEVKALAGQTRRATEEIGTQIAGMQRATTRSIDAIAVIETIIREIGDISGAIAAAVTEQGAATAEIARSVETAAKRTVETADEVNRVGSATADTRSSAGTVKAVADDLGSVAGRIRAQVDRFFERLSA
jgi:methyl-accepting chemotaxis protein